MFQCDSSGLVARTDLKCGSALDYLGAANVSQKKIPPLIIMSMIRQDLNHCNVKLRLAASCRWKLYKVPFYIICLFQRSCKAAITSRLDPAEKSFGYFLNHLRVCPKSYNRPFRCADYQQRLVTK